VTLMGESKDFGDLWVEDLSLVWLNCSFCSFCLPCCCYLDVFTTNHFIEGAKIELNKPVSQVFQVTHRFLLGSHNDYNFASFYAHSKVSPSLPTFQ